MMSEEWAKEYVSETEAPRRRKNGWGRRTREMKLDEAWEMKRKNIIENNDQYCRVLIKPSGNDCTTAISMDIDEVKACRELGIDLPSDWTVDISSGGNSPIAIFSPGSNPREVKARFKAWAQAVALAYASSLSCIHNSVTRQASLSSIRSQTLEAISTTLKNYLY